MGQTRTLWSTPILVLGLLVLLLLNAALATSVELDGTYNPFLISARQEPAGQVDNTVALQDTVMLSESSVTKIDLAPKNTLAQAQVNLKSSVSPSGEASIAATKLRDMFAHEEALEAAEQATVVEPAGIPQHTRDNINRALDQHLSTVQNRQKDSVSYHKELSLSAALDAHLQTISQRQKDNLDDENGASDGNADKDYQRHVRRVVRRVHVPHGEDASVMSADQSTTHHRTRVVRVHRRRSPSGTEASPEGYNMSVRRHSTKDSVDLVDDLAWLHRGEEGKDHAYNPDSENLYGDDDMDDMAARMSDFEADGLEPLDNDEDNNSAASSLARFQQQVHGAIHETLNRRHKMSASEYLSKQYAPTNQFARASAQANILQKRVANARARAARLRGLVEDANSLPDAHSATSGYHLALAPSSTTSPTSATPMSKKIKSYADLFPPQDDLDDEHTAANSNNKKSNHNTNANTNTKSTTLIQTDSVSSVDAVAALKADATVRKLVEKARHLHPRNIWGTDISDAYSMNLDPKDAQTHMHTTPAFAQLDSKTRNSISNALDNHMNLSTKAKRQGGDFSSVKKAKAAPRASPAHDNPIFFQAHSQAKAQTKSKSKSAEEPADASGGFILPPAYGEANVGGTDALPITSSVFSPSHGAGSLTILESTPEIYDALNVNDDGKSSGYVLPPQQLTQRQTGLLDQLAHISEVGAKGQPEPYFSPTRAPPPAPNAVPKAYPSQESIKLSPPMQGGGLAPEHEAAMMRLMNGPDSQAYMKSASNGQGLTNLPVSETGGTTAQPYDHFAFPIKGNVRGFDELAELRMKQVLNSNSQEYQRQHGASDLVANDDQITPPITRHDAEQQVSDAEARMQWFQNHQVAVGQ